MHTPVKPVYNKKIRICYLVGLLWAALSLQNFACAQTTVKPDSSGKKVDAINCPVFSYVKISNSNPNACVGENVNLGASTQYIGNGLFLNTFDWYVDGVLMQSGSDAFQTNLLTDSSKVWVILHYSFINGCPGGQATSNIITGFYPTPWRQPAVSITSSQTEPICPGSAITYTAKPVNGGNNPTYIWQVNGAPVITNQDSTFTITSLKNGDQVNCLLYIPAGSCLLANSVPSNILTAQFFPAVAPSVSITASTNNVDYGTPITFTATVANAGTTTNYQWQVNGVNVGTDSTLFTADNLNNGDKVTCVISTQDGCNISTGSGVITVNIKPPPPPPPITIPNTFTPNGDGINDTWKIEGLSRYPNIIVKIFNRLGAMVYQSSGYSMPWDGTTFNKRPLPDGVYYYVITPDNKTANLSGWLAIIR